MVRCWVFRRLAVLDTNRGTHSSTSSGPLVEDLGRVAVLASVYIFHAMARDRTHA